MTEEREMRLSSAELVKVSVSCLVCGAEVTVDVGNETQLAKLNSDFAPFACTICQAPLDSMLVQALRGIGTWRAHLKKARGSVTFRIPVR